MNIENILKYNVKKSENTIKNLKQENYDLNVKTDEKKSVYEIEAKNLKQENYDLKIKSEEKIKIYEKEIKNLRQENQDLKNETNMLKLKISTESESESESLKIKDKLEDKNIHYQEENLRIGNELFKTRNKLDIMSDEMGNYQAQKNNLIEKLNSINKLISNSNLLTNVFSTNMHDDNTKFHQGKNDQYNYPKIDTKKKVDINKEIKKIFSKQ